MERTKRKNVFRAELIIFLAVIAVSLLVLWIRWENSHATYKNYDIVVKKNVYCEKTQTGRVDLQIRRKGGKKAKLLQTQQELKQSQSFQIVEDSYKLGIVDDASAYDGNIYEQKNAGGIQYLTLYYVNHEASGRQGKMHLVMNDAKTGKELINIKTSPKVKKDARRYEYRGKDLYVSEEGILLDAGTDEEFYNSQAMTAGLMTVCWKNGKEKQIQFDPNADVSEYEAASEVQKNAAVKVVRQPAMDTGMYKVVILAKLSRYDKLRKAMNAVGVTGMTVTQVMGCGIQKGSGERYRGAEVDATLLPKVKVEVVIGNLPVDTVVEAAREALYTGHIGDGKIFVYSVDKIIKIRTGEEDLAALKDVE